MTLKTYTMLTKPGIIIGNAITTAGGFALASKGHFDIGLFLATLTGLSLVIASAGVFNNYIDRASDAKMERTKERPLATGAVSSTAALLFATLLALFGGAILEAYTNPVTLLVAAAGFFTYLVLYAFLKYRTFYGTIVGSLAGAVPPVAGYCAISGSLDLAAFLLFLIMVLWQMPHFFAIAIYRSKDYAAASIPVLPLTSGVQATKRQMTFYIVAFTVAACGLTIAGYTGYLYGAIALLLGGTWLGLSLFGIGQDSSKDILWARRMFLYSLVVILGLCLTIPFDLQIYP